jgi:hypothetical protein
MKSPVPLYLQGQLGHYLSVGPASVGGVSVDREALSAAFQAIDAAIADLIASDFDALAIREQLAMLERCEKDDDAP